MLKLTSSNIRPGVELAAANISMKRSQKSWSNCSHFNQTAVCGDDGCVLFIRETSLITNIQDNSFLQPDDIFATSSANLLLQLRALMLISMWISNSQSSEAFRSAGL